MSNRVVSAVAISLGLTLAATMACAPSDRSMQTLPGDASDAGTPADGDAAAEAELCDADFASDPAHCGSCDNACAPGQSCFDGACRCELSAPVSFSADVLPIFAASCAKGMCHAKGAGAMGLELSPDAAFAALVNRPSVECKGARLLVAPGLPDKSYLMDKLSGVRLCSGGRMPSTAGLPLAKVETITTWICDAAPQN